MIYEIINPSDPYTLESDDFAVACLATLLIGEGRFALHAVGDQQQRMPIFLFGNPDGWLIQTFGKSLETFLEQTPPEALAACLDSVLIGSPQDRQTYQEGLALIDDPAKKKQWRDTWHDQHRSSMNDIGRWAHKLAERFQSVKSKELHHLARRTIVRLRPARHR
jgi:hypothetical protein